MYGIYAQFVLFRMLFFLNIYHWKKYLSVCCGLDTPGPKGKVEVSVCRAYKERAVALENLVSFSIGEQNLVIV